MTDTRARLAGRLRFALLLLIAAGLCMAQIAPLEELARFPQRQLGIRSGKTGDTHLLDVWVADTPARQAQGLMFVRDLPPDRGMLFVYGEPRMLGMWMKNTYIELDILFIGADGRIVHVAERAQPHSLETIAPPRPAQYVLELRGGEAQRRALRPGDKVWQMANGGRTKL